MTINILLDQLRHPVIGDHVLFDGITPEWFLHRTGTT